MALFVLSDPHLSLRDAGKSMEAFGNRWQNYTQRIEKNWRAVVSPDDTVVLPGDISWAMTLEGAKEDFAFLQGLTNGKNGRIVNMVQRDWLQTAKLQIGKERKTWTIIPVAWRATPENVWRSVR